MGEELCIPANYVQWGQKANYVDAQICEGSILRCYPAELMSPSKFYVNLTENWSKLETFQQKLQGSMKGSDEVYELKANSIPRLELLAPGLFVLCNYFGPRDNRQEWHRAMILENPAYADGPGLISKHHSCEELLPQELNKIFLMVKLVDYGTIHETKIENIRYMQRSMMSFPIQAIECQLNFPPLFSEALEKGGHLWPAAACYRLDSFCFDRVLGVTFLKRSQVQCGAGTDEITNGKWIVSVDVMEGRPNDSNVGNTTAKAFSTLAVVEPEPNCSVTDADPEAQVELERRAFVKELDPSLNLHPDGFFSSLVAPQNHDLSVHFLQWIRQPEELKETD